MRKVFIDSIPNIYDVCLFAWEPSHSGTQCTSVRLALQCQPQTMVRVFKAPFVIFSIGDIFISTHYNDNIMSVMASQITSVSIVCLSVCSSRDQRKHQSSVSLAIVRGIHQWPVDSPYKGPVTQNFFFHLMTSSWKIQSPVEVSEESIHCCYPWYLWCVPICLRTLSQWH